MLRRALIDAMLRLAQTGTFEGIRIASFADNDFTEAMLSALRFLQAFDPPRFARVTSHLRWIVNVARAEGPGSLQYQHYGRYCYYDYEPWKDLPQTVVDAGHAGVLVHEATHGFLCTKGFRYTKENRIQVERICRAEENRFYRRVESSYPGCGLPLIQEFDPADWATYWTLSRWQRLLGGIRRVWQRPFDRC